MQQHTFGTGRITRVAKALAWLRPASDDLPSTPWWRAMIDIGRTLAMGNPRFDHQHWMEVCLLYESAFDGEKK